MVVAGGVLLSGISLAGVRSEKLAPGSSSGPLTAADAATLTPEETLSRAHQMQGQMAATEKRVVALQRRAETKRDMVMVNCTSDKLVQVRGYLAVGNQSVASIELAAQKHDDGARNHGFDRTNIVYQKVLVLGTEAEGCAGEDVSYVGETRVDVEVDPNIPVDDPTIPIAGVPPTATRPPEASPFA
ncbi:MAG: hypothetical protein ABI321_22040 [Polyangia bacterium]